MYYTTNWQHLALGLGTGSCLYTRILFSHFYRCKYSILTLINV